MLQCKCCKVEYPDYFISDLVIGEERQSMCPVCALELLNRYHQRPVGTPFVGPVAKVLFGEVVTWCRDNNIKLPAWCGGNDNVGI